MEGIEYLIDHLLTERGVRDSYTIPRDPEERFMLYRSLVNTRPAAPVPGRFLQEEDKLLKSMIQEKGITDQADLPQPEPGISLWQGDITTLKCGAIVNAANSGMTGCYQPCHSCIDNCIHTFAGVRLRYKCQELMDEQGHEEPTGQAKLTPAYDLPCDYVIHTVGPIVRGRLQEAHCRLLESCYRSCLELAEENGIKSLAFCCISTGVFGFPKGPAAEIALRTVREFVQTHDMRVIFCVFSDEDYDIYRRMLSGSEEA